MKTNKTSHPPPVTTIVAVILPFSSRQLGLCFVPKIPPGDWMLITSVIHTSLYNRFCLRIKCKNTSTFSRDSIYFSVDRILWYSSIVIAAILCQENLSSASRLAFLPFCNYLASILNSMNYCVWNICSIKSRTPTSIIVIDKHLEHWCLESRYMVHPCAIASRTAIGCPSNLDVARKMSVLFSTSFAYPGHKSDRANDTYLLGRYYG